MTVDDVITKILDDEGGVSNVGDGKGLTRYGQTPQWLTDNSLPIPTSRALAGENYRAWMTRIGLVKVIERDGFIGWIVTDMAVHFGVIPAVKLLQRTVGVKDDGILGPKTLAAIPVGSGTVARRLVAAKGIEYGRLLASTAVDRRQWARGWLARLGRQIEALP